LIHYILARKSEEVLLPYYKIGSASDVSVGPVLL